MKSYKPKYLSDYSNELQRRILHKEPAFSLDVKFSELSKLSVKKNKPNSKIQGGQYDTRVNPNDTIFKIIADKIQPNGAISVINRFIAVNNTTIDKLLQYIKNIKNIQYNNHDNLEKHLRVLMTNYKTVINIDGNKETNKLINDIMPNVDVKNIDMLKFVEDTPVADLYIFNKCISKYSSEITNKLAGLKGAVFVCDYDIENESQLYYINFADKLLSIDDKYYTKKINIINLIGREPTGESKVLINNLYNEYAIMFS